MTCDKTVVCNAGPLIVLAKLNALHLLEKLYSRVHIAEAVFDEVIVEGLRHGHADARTAQIFLQEVGWHPESVALEDFSIDAPDIRLDRGELETLALAHRHRPAFVLIDEYWGRKIARRLELPMCGSLGILVSAYRKRFVDTQQLHLYFSEMRHRQDIWINPRLIERLSREILDDTDVISPTEEL